MYVDVHMYHLHLELRKYTKCVRARTCTAVKCQLARKAAFHAPCDGDLPDRGLIKYQS